MTAGGVGDRGVVRVLAVMEGTGTGGAETSIAAMAPLMGDHGVELEIAYFHDRSGAKERLVDAAIPLWHVRPGPTRLATVQRLRRLIRERRPDVVHTMVFEADVIGRTAGFMAGVPVVSSIINEMYGPTQMAEATSKLRLRGAQLADVATARFVTEFHAITQAIAAEMAPRLHLGRSRITVIPRGRDLRQLGRRSPIRRNAVRERFGIDARTPVILAVARQERQKGLDVAVEAMPTILRRVPDAVLLVAGRPGSATRDIERLILSAGIGDHVRLLGHRADVADLLAAADVMAFPSRWEGLGSALVEAAAVGCPIVCSDLPVTREVVGAAGFDAVSFTAPGDAEALADALCTTLAETDAANPGSQMVTFSISDVARRHAEMYSRLAEAPARSRLTVVARRRPGAI